MSKIVLYLTTVSSNMAIKKHQQKIKAVLEGKKIEFEEVDIAASTELKEKMREIVGDPKCLPPQICKGEQYIGDYDAFDAAVEEETLNEFLKL